jgi:hypothetical protein
MKIKKIDVTRNRQRVAEFVRCLGRITSPVEIMVDGNVVGRFLPPGELSETEKVLRRGWQLVQEARIHTKGIPQKTIGKIVDAAVKKVRARKK